MHRVNANMTKLHINVQFFFVINLLVKMINTTAKPAQQD